MLMCVVFLMTGGSIPALAEKQAATPTDLIGTEEPAAEETFEQKETVNGVRIIVTAEPGVFAAGTRLSIRKTDSAAFEQAAEAALESEKGNGGLIVHEIYSFSGAQINGTARVRLEKLRLKDLQEQYPDAEIRVFVLRYDETARELRDKAQKVSASISVDSNTAAFDITEPGLFDIAAAVRVPKAEKTEEQKPSAEDPDDPAEEKKQPADEEQTTPEIKKQSIQTAEEPGEVILSGADAKPEEETEENVKTGKPDQIKAFVTRCYELILGREPDPAGLKNWTDKLKKKSATAAQIISGFLNSKEFAGKRKTAEELVEILYKTMLNRASDYNGKINWLRKILDGASMNQLINGFCESAEFKGLCAKYGIESGKLESGKKAARPIAYSQKLVDFVSRCYREALGRNADAEGLHFWCMKLVSNEMSFKQVAKGFVFSQEMRNKKLNNEAFIKTLYRLYLGREAEAAGLSFWKNKMADGMTREQVNDGFANSAEFEGIIASFDPEAIEDLPSTFTLTADINELTIRNGGRSRAILSPELAGKEKNLIWKSSDGHILNVKQNGEIFGNYPGKAVLTVSTKAGKVIKSVTMTVRANYRAVLFSESTYAEGTLKRNRGDVRLMKTMLASVTGPDGGKYVVYSFDDLVANDIYNKTESLLIAPSRDGDVSIFFFAGHGDYRSKDPQYAGRLWCRRKQTWVELPELAKRLSRTKGKVIVLLESCGPGAALLERGNLTGAALTEEDEMADDRDLSEAVIRAFSSADPGLNIYQPELMPAGGGQGIGQPASRGEKNSSSGGALENGSGNLFLTEKFIVMVASGYLKSSYSIGTDTYNLFPYGIAKGVGTSGAMPADTEYGNGDGLLTVNELFKYVYQYTKRRQIPLVYPENSSYVLFKR
uniref:Hemolysin-type calcium-binding region n=1 Tax=uncultured bacterium Contig21 TaxID=1393535 RepID=W0FPZ9_9BACT|nr:hemolysin-type calcium-binding region [uncultured bacterium Contig21]